MTERTSLVSAWMNARTARVSAEYAYTQSRHADARTRWDDAARIEAAAWAAIRAHDADAASK